MSLSGKTIVVTGASSGIGRQTAVVLSRLGACLVLIARNRERLEETRMQLDGTNHRTISFDLNQLDEIPSLFKKIASDTGPLSGVFHAAGVVSIVAARMIKSRNIYQDFTTGPFASLMIARAFSQKGVYSEQEITSLLFMSSAAGLTGTRGLSIYASSKAAVDGAVRALAVELSERKIRVNSLAAGMVRTEMHDSITEDITSERLLDREKQHPLRFGEPMDVALSAAFLLSDAAKWITGTTLIVDGGFSISKS